MFERSNRLALACLALGLCSSVGAQEIQRVEITGSSVKRIDTEGALPVQMLRREDIERTGATSTTDLLQRLPAMQGGFNESASVGGESKGFAGVSIHNLGDTRTLVLLNGHRLALFGGQTLTGFAAGFDLNAIPISAIERVEILTDGASALYGADAIAGVVNFITRRDTTEGDVALGFSSPRGGAREKRISVSKGFGSLVEDGFNAMLTLSHDERTQLNATSRNFSKTGRVFFQHNGQSYRKQQFSVSPIPANALNDNGELISPYQRTNGACPDKTFRVIEPYTDGGVDYVDDYCGFDFVGELEIYPIRKRDSAMASLTKRLGDHELFADILASRTELVSRTAPVPGAIEIPASSPLFAQYLAPVGITQDTLAFYRLFDLGKRESTDKPTFFAFAVGSRGLVADWDYNATLAHSQSKANSSLSGYPGALAVRRLTASGLLNPFVGPGQQTTAAQDAINAANYRGYWDGGKSTLDTLQLRGSRELMALPGGAMQLGTGISFLREKVTSAPSLFAQGKLADPVAGTLCDPASSEPSLACDQRFGDESAKEPYSASRNAYGLFGEVVMPVAQALELTTSLRYDHYSDFGNATTAKASFRWTPHEKLLLRGSIGTGFHAPTVPQVNASLQPYGVTGDSYLCTPDLAAVAASLSANCQPGNLQYDQLAGGNPGLQPEKTRQATIGLRFEPTNQVSFGLDLWHVAIRDAFGQLTEQEVFANPLNFPASWGTKADTGTGVVYLAFLADNKNLGKSYSTGLDFEFLGRARTALGDWKSKATVTYMIREVRQLEKGGTYYSAIGNFAELGTVTFRWAGHWTNTLTMGSWAHTLGLNFKSGYRDQESSVDLLDASGNVVSTENIRLPIKEYFTLDWQTSLAARKDLLISVGALNLFDVHPPLAISTGGFNRGQQFGYDDRYYDPRGRTLYANVSYKF